MPEVRERLYNTLPIGQPTSLITFVRKSDHIFNDSDDGACQLTIRSKLAAVTAALAYACHQQAYFLLNTK